MDTKILGGIAILVIFVVIIGILMMKNKDSYTAPTIPSATDIGWVFTEAGMNFLLSPQGGLSANGITSAPNTWMKSAAWINWVNLYASGSGGGWLSTPEGKSAINYMTNNYPVYIGGLALAIQHTAFPDMS